VSDQTETWKIVSTGIAVGIGLTAASVAILLQFPVGQDLMRVIRKSSQPTQATPLPEGYYYAPVSAPTTSEAPVESAETLLDGQPLPATVKTVEPISVLMGRTRVPLPPGETLSVVGTKDTFFLCDYLGDTISVPIVSTDWQRRDP
jgi:hypothetical protein